MPVGRVGASWAGAFAVIGYARAYPCLRGAIRTFGLTGRAGASHPKTSGGAGNGGFPPSKTSAVGDFPVGWYSRGARLK